MAGVCAMALSSSHSPPPRGACSNSSPYHQLLQNQRTNYGHFHNIPSYRRLPLVNGGNNKLMMQYRQRLRRRSSMMMRAAGDPIPIPSCNHLQQHNNNVVVVHAVNKTPVAAKFKYGGIIAATTHYPAGRRNAAAAAGGTNFICTCHRSNNQGHQLISGPPASTLCDDGNGMPEPDDYYKKGVKYLVDTAPAEELKQLPLEFVLPLPENPLAVSYGDIPVIDLSGLEGPPESRISTVRDISSACAKWGVFRIVKHGVEVGVMDEMMKVAEEFFGLSLTEKMRYASDDVMSPIRYGTSLNTSKEHSRHWRDFFRHYGHPFQESFHLWPLNPPNYRDVAKEFLEQVRKAALRIGGAMSEGLGLDENYIDENLLGDGQQILAANYYPECPEPEKTLGQAAHSDHGAITILMDNGVDGLQVKHKGSWVAVPHVPASFIVNLGDTMEIVSNGKYKSVEHRATVKREKTRISVAVGHGPNLSSYIGPAAPQAVDDGNNNNNEEMKFRAILYAEYLKMQQTSTLRGKSALDAIRI